MKNLFNHVVRSQHGTFQNCPYYYCYLIIWILDSKHLW